MNFQTKQRPLPPSARMAIVKDAPHVSRRGNSTTTTSFLTRLAGIIRSVIANVFASPATESKQAKKIARELLRQNAISAKRAESENRQGFRAPGLPGSARRYRAR